MSSFDVFQNMKAEDRRRAAERLLDDQLAMGMLAMVEAAAIQAMIDAPDDQGRREARDTVRTVRAFVDGLRTQVRIAEQASRQPAGMV